MRKQILNAELHRPGLALTGFLERFANRRVQILGCSSSKFIKTTTTVGEEQKPNTELQFPKPLSAAEVDQAVRLLDTVPDAVRQAVLDELQGRLSSPVRGAPIQNPLSYLAKLCQAATRGTFQLTSAGLAVQQARRQTHAFQRALTHRPPLPVSAEAVNDCSLAQRLLAIRDRQQAKQATRDDLESTPAVEGGPLGVTTANGR